MRMLAVALAAAVAVAACGGDGDEGPAGEDAGSAPTTGEPSPAGAEPTCADGALGERSYVLCTAGDQGGQGLVVALHGRGSSAAAMQAGTGLHEAAAAEGLAVVYPESLDGGWGDDTFTSAARPAGDEDVAFLDALVDDLRADDRIADEGDVGVVGFSNGASMAMRYAVERPDDVRAAVAVAGQLPRDPDLRPTARVPLLLVYGTDDPVRPYDTGIPESPGRAPGDPTPTLPTAESVAAFVAVADGSADHDGPVESDPDPADGTRLRTERWSDGDGTVAVLVAVVGGGHTWPSSRTPPEGGGGFGPTSTDLDASADAIAFVVDPDRAGT
jgi:polyhydroxybutyrate depolymerase